MDKHTIAATAAAIRSLDLTAENAAIEDLQGEIGRLREAIANGETRLAENRRALAAQTGPDARAVADALLDGAPASEAAVAGPTDAELRAEQESLRAGIGELREREVSARREIDDIRDGVARTVAAQLAPLADAAMGQMRHAAEMIIEGHAAVAALNELTRQYGLAILSTRQAVAGVMGMDKLLEDRRYAEVPPEIRDTLRALARLGPAMPVRPVDTISLRL